MRMRVRINNLIKILLVLIICIGLNNTTLSQDKAPTKVIELTQGCKLCLDSNIDLTDSVSMNIVNKIQYIIPKIQSLIPLDSIAINVAISKTNVLPFLGIGGRTNKDESGISINYYYDPDNPNFKTESFINGLVHECHHASRLRMPDWKLTLLEVMIMEGLADHFMIEVTNCEQPQWSKALNRDEIKEYMIKAKPILFITHNSWTKKIDEWLTSGRKGDDPIPVWTGYSIGWTIVENYFKVHPGASASTLVFTSAEEIAGSTPELKVDK